MFNDSEIKEVMQQETKGTSAQQPLKFLVMPRDKDQQGRQRRVVEVSE